MAMKTFAAFILLPLVQLSTAYPCGPPIAWYANLCKTMTPQHGASKPQSSASPYTLSVGANCYTIGQPITVNITGTKDFTGFLVEARKPNTDTFSYGTFGKTSAADNTVQTFNCFCGSNNAVGHNNSEGDDWQLKQFVWTPPTGLGGNIEFVATIVEDEEDFWVGLRTPLLPCDVNATDTSIVPSSNCTLPTPPVEQPCKAASVSSPLQLLLSLQLVMLLLKLFVAPGAAV